MMFLKRVDRFIPLSIVAGILFFLALSRLDFPRPHIDDLFYVGAGINLSQGGELSNPLLVRQGFVSHYFFVYPPLHSYALAGWLKAFGVNAGSLMGFQMLSYVITAGATIVILRKLGAPIWLEWLVPLGVSTAMLPIGLRPEPMATALTMAGFAILACGGDRLPAVWIGFLLMFLGGSAAPRVAPLSAGLAFLSLWRLRQNAGPKSGKFLRILAPAGVVLGIVLLIFLTQIHFAIGEFWRTFHVHARERVAGSRILLALRFVFGYPDSTQVPLLLLLAVLLSFPYTRPWSEPVLLAIAIFGGLFLAGTLGLLGHGTLWFCILALFALTIPVFKKVPPDRAKLLTGAVAGCFLFANVGTAVQIYGALMGKIDTDQGPQRERALATRPAVGQFVLVDSPMARYLFDYRLPTNFLDFHFAGNDAVDYAATGIGDGDVVVGGPETIGAFRFYGFLRKRTRQWRPWGLPGLSFDAHPRRVYILRANDLEPGEEIEP